MRVVIAWLVGAVTVVHGLIHLLGVVKGFGWAEVSRLTAPISTAMGLAWLGAAVLVVVAGVMMPARASGWWVVAGVAALVSQVVIVASWADAKAGTVVNVVLVMAASWGFFADGPASLRAEYERTAAATRAAAAAPSGVPLGVVTERDLARLPSPVAEYVRASGAVGRPRVVGFAATIEGRIRGGRDAAWMTFTGTQVNTFGADQTRVFFLDATMKGLPADVLHTYVAGQARMQVRAASVVRVVDVCGPALTRAETVTLLNDLVVFAPAAVVDAPITWESVDERCARATYTSAGHTVSAELLFDESHRLVDFVSDDRAALSEDGKVLTPQRWSTPISEHRDIDGRWAGIAGHGRWHPADAEPFDYLEIRLDHLTSLEAP
jgi:hypothetical protein